LTVVCQMSAVRGTYHKSFDFCDWHEITRTQ
jgi:hypothetical protein